MKLAGTIGDLNQPANTPASPPAIARRSIIIRENFRVTAPATPIRIEIASEANASGIASILLRAFAEFEAQYTPQAFAATIAGESGVITRMREGPVFVAFRGGQLVGTAAAVQRDQGTYVRQMAVIPEARGLGIGYLLLREVSSFAMNCRARRLFLSTTPFLTSAIVLYEKFGFRRTDEGPHDLFGTPLFTMEKPLDASTVQHTSSVSNSSPNMRYTGRMH